MLEICQTAYHPLWQSLHLIETSVVFTALFAPARPTFTALRVRTVHPKMLVVLMLVLVLGLVPQMLIVMLGMPMMLLMLVVLAMVMVMAMLMASQWCW